MHIFQNSNEPGFRPEAVKHRINEVKRPCARGRPHIRPLYLVERILPLAQTEINTCQVQRRNVLWFRTGDQLPQ